MPSKTQHSAIIINDISDYLSIFAIYNEVNYKRKIKLVNHTRKLNDNNILNFKNSLDNKACDYIFSNNDLNETHFMT